MKWLSQSEGYWRTKGPWWTTISWSGSGPRPHIVLESAGGYSVAYFATDEPPAGPFDTLEAAQAAAELMA